MGKGKVDLELLVWQGREQVRVGKERTVENVASLKGVG